MGYTTDFTGKFKLNERLDKETYEYLVKFSNTRRMKRDMTKLFPEAEAASYGVEGEFYVGGDDNTWPFKEDPSVLDSNKEPSTQPNLNCDWIPSEDRLHIEWNGCEKFYDYEEWLKYLIKNFLLPKGYTLKGSVEFQGEDDSDHGWLNCYDSTVWKSFSRQETNPPDDAGGPLKSSFIMEAKPKEAKPKEPEPKDLTRKCNWVD